MHQKLEQACARTLLAKKVRHVQRGVVAAENLVPTMPTEDGPGTYSIREFRLDSIHRRKMQPWAALEYR
jgi:hypothetical protein